MRQPLMILFVFHSLIALSQPNNNYNFRHIDQSDGLLHNEVLSITQDAKGFIWIGTTNGLQRFDGQRFLNYHDEIYAADKKIIGVENIYFDGKDGLWIYGNLRLDKLELLKNKIINYNGKSILNERSAAYTSYTDIRNNPWLVGKFSVFNYDTVEKKMMLYSLDLASATANNSCNIFSDVKQGQTWVAAYGGLLLFDTKTKKVYNKNDSLKHPLLQLKVENGFSKIMIDGQHNIWVTSWNHLLYRYDPITGKISTYSLADITARQGVKNNDGTLLVNYIFRDAKDNIWLGTENAGLLKYNRQQDNFDYIISGKENKQGLQYNYNIFCIFQDKEENIWLGTDKGINIFNPYHQYFRSIHHEENNNSIPKNEITGFIETKDRNVLVGTWGGGIAIYDSSLHFKKNIVLKGGIPENNLVWSFIKNDDGKIWVGCQHGYIHIYDPVKEKIISTLHPMQLDSSTIRCMQKDQQGNIWFGLHNGKIAEWNRSLNTFIAYGDGTTNTLLSIAPVYNIFIDNHQNFWIGTDNGFKQFDSEKKIYTSVSSPGENDQAIPAQQIRGIEQYNDSILLVGTLSGGLNYFNIKTKIFSSLFTSLPSNNIYAIKKDATNNIWFTTDYGLYKINNDDKKIITYNIDQGMINSSFVSNNFYQLENGRWLTATGTEVISFNTDTLSLQSSYSKNVTITGFKVFDKSIFIDSLLAENKPVTLDYSHNFFTIEFAALDFSNILQTKYVYRLSGIDKDWVNAGTKTFANYTNLDAGTYTFSVRTEEGDADHIVSFSIIITPPFWKTWWFETVVVLVAVVIIYLLIRKRIISIKHEAALKQKIAETEMQALRAQMNPHFIFNCLNAIDNLIQTNQKDKATTYLARFAKLIRAVLDSSKNNVVPFYKEYETLSLFLQLEQFRCSNKFEYELTADEEITNGDYKVPPLLIQPFIENAIHHGLMNKTGTDKKLSVQIGVQNGNIQYIIKDNGVGRLMARQIKNLNKPEHISYGIGISTERVHLYNKNGNENNVVITDLYADGKPVGTRVEVCININSNN